MSFFIFNDKILPNGTSILGPDNRGLKYGDGLFETMKFESGELIFEEEHFERLWHGMETLGFEFPAYFTKDNLKQQVLALVTQNNIQNGARIRLNIFRGDGGLIDTTSNKPEYIIQASPLRPGMGEWNKNGLILGVYDHVKKSCDILSNLKHNNYLPYVMASLHAKRAQWNDAVVLNSLNRLADTSIANIFIIKDELIQTPRLSEGCVAGIMRKMLLRHLVAAKWQVAETELTVQDILSADEVFLTNSIQNIKWVQRLGDTIYDNELTKKIYNSFTPTIS